MNTDPTHRAVLRWAIPVALAVVGVVVYVAFNRPWADTGHPVPTTTPAAADLAATTSANLTTPITTAATTTTPATTTTSTAATTTTSTAATTTTVTTITPTVCEDGYYADGGECHPDHPDEEAVEAPVGAEGAQVSPEETVWWRPGLGDEAFALLDPDQAGADHVILMAEDRKWGTYQYYLFYHGMVEGSAAEADLFWDVGETFRRIHQEATLWVYYPYRYDLAWVDYPTVMEVTATFPLGEVLVVVFHRDGQYWAGEWDGVEFPTGPPIRPTTPFAEPRYPDTAQALGRDCPPVEDLWQQGSEVTDPCTVAAVSTAIRYVDTGPTPHRMAAIRDGHTLGGVFAWQDNLDDLVYGRYYTEAGRASTVIEVETMQWAGSFPQASMIEVGYRIGRPPVEITDELRQAFAADYESMVKYLSDTYSVDPPLTLQEMLDSIEQGGVSPYVFEMLAVRSADGTWRLSYRSFCTQWVITSVSWNPAWADRVVCPPDPTPWFPDSAFFDTDIYPPNHLWYYNDPRALGDDSELAWTYDRGGMEKHRLAGEYLGVPPS